MPSLVQQATGGNGASSSFTVTLSSPPTAGNTLICVAGTNDAITSVSSSGATWVLPASSNAHVAAYIYVAYNVSPGAGTVITVTLSSALKGAANVSEWSGLEGSVDQTGTNNGSGTSITSATITPTADNELVFHAVSWQGSAESNGPTGGLTPLTKATGGTLFSAGAYLIQSSAAQASTTYTIPSSGWDSVIASFLTTAQTVDVMVGMSTTDGFVSSHVPPWFSPQNRFGRLNSAGQPYSIPFNVTVASAEASLGTGAASGATGSIAPHAGLVSGVGASNAATEPTLSAVPSVASGTGAVSTGRGTIAQSAGLASGTGAAQEPSETVAVSTARASATGTSNDAAIISTPPDNVAAPAALAAGTGGSFNATTSLAPHAGLSSATGSTASAPSLAPNAGLPSGTGTAQSPAISEKPTAGLASGAGASLAAAASLAVTAGLPAGTGAAQNVNHAIEVFAGLASGTGAAYSVITAGASVLGGTPPSVAFVEHI